MVDEDPPAPRDEVVVARPGFVFVHGRWQRQGKRNVWVEGRWTASGGVTVR